MIFAFKEMKMNKKGGNNRKRMPNESTRGKNISHNGANSLFIVFEFRIENY